MLGRSQSCMNEPFYIGLRETVVAQIKSGKLTEDTDLSEALDSLDRVQLEMETEELGVETTVSIKSVGDLLWLFRAIDLKREHNEKNLSQ
jgi:hypothetical protein